MSIRQLARREWKPYLDQLSRNLADVKPVEVDVSENGQRSLREWLPLLVFAYDPAEDCLTLVGEGWKEVIRNPKQVGVEEVANWMHRLDIVDTSGAHRIVTPITPLRVL
jgi:hypothetical protein